MGNLRYWLRKGDQKIHDVLQKQDGLYTLIVKHPDGKIDSQVIGSIIDFKLGHDTPDVVMIKWHILTQK